MADFSLLLEAEKRGILPEDKKALLAEARNRGLVPAGDPGAVDTGSSQGAAPTEPGADEYLLDRAKQGAAGFMGFPGDLLDMAANPPMRYWPTFGTLFREVGDRLGLLSRETRIPTERVMANAPLYKEAFGVKNLKTENDAMRYLGGVVEMGAAGGPMMAASGVRALPMVTSSVGAGLGLEAGGDTAEGLGLNRQAGEAAGAVAGGIVPAVTGSLFQGGTGWLRSRFSPSAQRANAEVTVARELGPLVEAPAARQNLDRSIAVSDRFAEEGLGFTPSLPARTGSPGLLAIEKDLVTRSPKTLNAAVERIEANERAIKEFVNKTIPAGKETAVSRIARLQRVASDKLEAMRQAVDDKLDDLARVFEGSPNNYEVGKKVRDLVFKQKEVYRGISAQKYQDVYQTAEKMGVRADVSDMAQFADDVLKSEFNAYQQSEIPPVFRQLAQRAGKDLPEGAGDFLAAQGGKKPGDVSFAELHSLYKRTNADLASLRGSQSADKGLKEYLLGQLKTRLEQKLAGFEEAGFGEVAAKLKDANAFYRNEYLPRFKQGFGDDVLGRYTSGEFKVPNQNVLGLITRENNAQAARDFKMLFDDVPEAWQGLRDGYMDMLVSQKNVLTESGKVNQKALDTFLRRHAQTLKEFPQIRNEFQQLALDNRALLERQQRVVAAQKELAAADIYKLFNGKDPGVVVPEAIGNPNAMRVLVHKARHTPREGQSLARAIADHVVQQGDPIDYFAKNRETIKLGLQSLGKDHFSNLETAIEAMSINRRSQLPNFVQQSGIAPDPIASATGSSPRAIVAHYVNIQRGRTGLNQEAAAFLGRWFDRLRADHKAVAMEAVFYDPNAARAIAQLAKQPGSPGIRTDFVNAMATLGIRAEIAGQE